MEQTKYHQLINTFRLNDKDTGSSAVQIINLTFRILELTEHLKIQKKDITAKRSLIKMVAARKRLLKYYKTQDLITHSKLLTALSLKDN